VAWVSSLGAGCFAEGDFVAEAGELADVVADLPGGVAFSFVVVPAEVLIPHAGVG
jgi:hypothetical protein